MSGNPSTRKDSRKLRGAAVFVAGVLIGGLLISPAGAHVTTSFKHLWNEHIKPRLATPGTINDAANPVDWTKLKGVPGDFADGVDNTGGPPGPATDVQCTGCVASSDVGTITVRTASVDVAGNTGQNGNYVTSSVQKTCEAGERAIGWGAYWSNDVEGLELVIQSAQFIVDANGLQGYKVRGGSDIGSTTTLTLQVRCLAA